MKLKQLEELLTNHLIESTGIKQKLYDVDKKVNWVLGLVACAFIALLSSVITKG